MNKSIRIRQSGLVKTGLIWREVTEGANLEGGRGEGWQPIGDSVWSMKVIDRLGKTNELPAEINDAVASYDQWPAIATEQLLHTHTCTHPATHTRTAVMRVVTCPLDDFHHVWGEVAHAVISCPVVVNAALPTAIRVLFQNLTTQTHTVWKIPLIESNHKIRWLHPNYD